MRRHPLQPKTFVAALAALLTYGVVAPDAMAQIFAGVGSVTTPVADVAPAVPAALMQSHEILRFLPNTLDGLRLSGESGELRWPIYLTAAQASAPIRVRVGYVSSISILPDVSSLKISVNGKAIGADIIDAAHGSKIVEFAVPQELLSPGYNALSIAVIQRHRIDCSVDATYELWTKIDPSATGLLLPNGTQTISNLGDLAALLLKSDGTLPIHILLAGKTNPAHLRHLIKATQQIALSAHALQPAVEFTTVAGEDAYGVNLAIGTRETLGHLPGLANELGMSGPLTRMIAAVGDGRPTLVVTGANDDEIDQAIAQLVPSASPNGTREGRLAIVNYPAFSSNGDAHLPLRDLGLTSEAFSGRLFRRSVNLMLPADFLASDYARGTFDLAGAYSAGLSRDAQFRVDINGSSSGIVKFPYKNGDSFKHNQLFLPLHLMRPGLNRIDVIAETATPDDATCSARDSKRFQLQDTSEIVLPALAHIQRLPDLAVTTGGGVSFGNGQPHLVVPKPDRETMGAALSLTARAAVAAGRIIPFDFSTKVTADDTGSTLVVSPAQTLDPALMETIGLDPKKVETVWQDRVATSQADVVKTASDTERWWLTQTEGPSACHVPMQRALPRTDAGVTNSGSFPSASEANGTDHLSLIEQSHDEAPTIGWWDHVAKVFASAADLATKTPGSIRASTAMRNGAIDPHASLIIAQGMSPNSRTNVTTIVTAPDSKTLRASVACLSDPQVWSKMHGRLAVLDASDGELTATDATTFHYIASGPMTLSNSRLVIAGWFSLNPITFVAFALLTALCLSGTTLWFVRGVGRRPE